MPNVSLTPELEGFAEGCVASGRYGNVSEVMRAALRLLRDQKERQRAFVTSLDRARAEAEASGYLELETVMAEFDAANGAGR